MRENAAIDAARIGWIMESVNLLNTSVLQLLHHSAGRYTEPNGCGGFTDAPGKGIHCLQRCYNRTADDATASAGYT
jgi:hypothetical protein